MLPSNPSLSKAAAALAGSNVPFSTVMVADSLEISVSTFATPGSDSSARRTRGTQPTGQCMPGTLTVTVVAFAKSKVTESLSGESVSAGVGTSAADVSASDVGVVPAPESLRGDCRRVFERELAACIASHLGQSVIRAGTVHQHWGGVGNTHACPYFYQVEREMAAPFARSGHY